MIRRHKGPRKVLVVHAHPVPQSFNTLLRDTTVRSLTESGHEVRSIDLYAEGFTPELSLDEHTNHLGPLADKPLIAAHAADLRWADALVLIYPTWWSGPR
jgi:NAD(P)H dehydrogenase (quinone)